MANTWTPQPVGKRELERRSLGDAWVDCCQIVRFYDWRQRYMAASDSEKRQKTKWREEIGPNDQSAHPNEHGHQDGYAKAINDLINLLPTY